MQTRELLKNRHSPPLEGCTVHFVMHAFSSHVKILHNVTPIDLLAQSVVLFDGVVVVVLHNSIPLLWRGGRRSLTGWLWWFCTRQLPSTRRMKYFFNNSTYPATFYKCWMIILCLSAIAFATSLRWQHVCSCSKQVMATLRYCRTIFTRSCNACFLSVWLRVFRYSLNSRLYSVRDLMFFRRFPLMPNFGIWI